MPYLIDGNNLLGSWGGPRGGDDRRAEVVRRVSAFCRRKRVKVTLVFDGGRLRPDLAAQDLGDLTLRVPERGASADDLIRELIERADRAGDWIVVTSDKALYSYVKTLGAKVMRAHEWNNDERRNAPEASEGDEKPSRENDVEGWLKKFGGS